MGQARGRQTILECVITAFPQTVNYWEKDAQRLTGSAKYHVDVYDDGDHRIVLYALRNLINSLPIEARGQTAPRPPVLATPVSPR